MINKAWHDKHKMPKKPTTDQRIEWHVAHAKNCGCRPISQSLKTEMAKRGINV